MMRCYANLQVALSLDIDERKKASISASSRPLIVLLLPTLLLLFLGMALSWRSGANESWKKRRLNVPQEAWAGHSSARPSPSESSIPAPLSAGTWRIVFRDMERSIARTCLARRQWYWFVLMNDGKLFESSWPKSVADISGKTSMLVLTGEMHRYMKSLSVNFIGIARLRNHFFLSAISWRTLRLGKIALLSQQKKKLAK
ncbi:hypothetical protein J5N97_013595 [Dioscorea zingiberensis]|uniref:Uncharacterized protein n=1 Tax=Dioscorea zingiberensis TaxID=325984 RepID=A0A9D5HIS6_9LILI|nr:hypothetical protein J5N97_013595 [Dioscorea zingiberensis]